MEQGEAEKSTQEIQQTQGRGLKLDGEAWKEKDATAYTSILDLNGASDLFSQENTQIYEAKRNEEQIIQEELKEYIFTDRQQEQENEAELVDYIFTREISLSKVKDYTADNTNDGSGTIYTAAAVLLAGVLFAAALYRYNSGRKKRREKFATEINMENIGTK